MTLTESFAWYSQLAQKPGWSAYVWDRAQEMAKEHPELFARLPAMLAKDHPGISQVTLTRSVETSANTWKIPADFRPYTPKEKK